MTIFNCITLHEQAHGRLRYNLVLLVLMQSNAISHSKKCYIHCKYCIFLLSQQSKVLNSCQVYRKCQTISVCIKLKNDKFVSKLYPTIKFNFQDMGFKYKIQTYVETKWELQHIMLLKVCCMWALHNGCGWWPCGSAVMSPPIPTCHACIIMSI